MTAPTLPADSPEAIERAAEIIRQGGLVAMPTETVYGLAADASNADAVARLYEAKGRPSFNPLIAHVSDFEMAARLGHMSKTARGLISAFWPGPLTLVLPKKSTAPICDLANAGLDSVAVRSPAHPAARALISLVNRPLVAPSANPSGTISPTTAHHVAEGLGDKIDLILDGGACPIGLESTVLAVADERAILLRPGGLDRGAIEPLTGPLPSAEETATPPSPGMMKSHYAPHAPVLLNAHSAPEGGVLLGFGAKTGDLNLSETGDLAEAATRLFAALRKLDTQHPSAIAVVPIPDHGLGEAINDRLNRAAAPRE